MIEKSKQKYKILLISKDGYTKWSLDRLTLHCPKSANEIKEVLNEHKIEQ